VLDFGTWAFISFSLDEVVQIAGILTCLSETEINNLLYFRGDLANRCCSDSYADTYT
jgi:hypothetical protein